MGVSYDLAVSALYRAPFESFVAERKRLAAELKAEGDKSGAAQFAKLVRPPISAWAVNQLWWCARETFDELFETAAELRRGELAASPAHRRVLARLGARAEQLLSEGGHRANDATLRRVTMTLAGLAARGSFDPDPPGALTKDRDPPGFDAVGTATSSEAPVENEPAVAAERTREAEAAEERKREAEAAEARKREAEAQAAERRAKLQAELDRAKAALVQREHERDHLEKQVAVAERELERARAAVAAVQAQLDAD